MKKRLSIIIVATVVLSVLVAACAPAPTPTPVPTTPTPAPPKVLKIGVLGPFTGPAARVGEEFKAALTMAFEDVNWTIGPYKIELVWIDSESDPEKGARAYEEAVLRDKIVAGIDNWHSSVAVSCMEIAAKHKIPHFFGNAATKVINDKYETDPEKYSYWMGKTWPAAYKLSMGYVEALEEAIEKGIWTPDKKTAAIYGEDTDWGRDFGGAIKEDLKKAGWEVVAEEYFAMEEVEFYPLLKKFKDLDVRLVAGTTTTAPLTSAFIKQSREVGLKAFLIADGLSYIGEWYKLTGEASDYVLDMLPAWTTDEGKVFAKEFEERWGFKPSPSAAGHSYDFGHFFIKLAKRALEKYGEINSETLYKIGQEELWAGKLTFAREDGAIVHECYKYTPETIPDPIVGVSYYMFPVKQYFGGKGKIIWPEKWKEADLKVPPWMKE